MGKMNNELLLAGYLNPYRLGLETDLGLGFGRVFFPLFLGFGCLSSEPVGTE